MSILPVLNPFTAAECYCHGIAPNSIPSRLRETYSQDCEDAIISSTIASLLARSGGKCEDIRYVDIGANHPIHFSNTYLFYRACGASGVLFEPHPIHAADLRRLRPRDTLIESAVSDRRGRELDFYVANASEISSLDPEHAKAVGGDSGGLFVESIQRATNLHVDEAFQHHWPQGEVHFLSIDAEGCDLPIVRAIEWTKYRPWTVCVEAFPVGVCQPITDKMLEAGYMLTAVTDHNLIFVDRRWL